MGAWQEIVDYTVPSNTTSVVLDSFGTITKDDFVKVVLTIVAGSGGGGDYRLLANSSVTTNYHRQYILGTSSTVAAARENSASIAATETGQTSTVIAYLKLSENDRLNIFANDTRRNDSSTQVLFGYVTSSGATFASGITSLTFTGDSANKIGTGSRIQIYKLAAEKVADITVGSNTTQVDISSLSIDKDSEYLLVSDISTGGTGGQYDLFINDNTTATTYYSQGIFGIASSASAQRFNSARYASTPANRTTVVHTHIKLSNIGAYTAQSYEIRESGTSTVGILNYFLSSTSEAITSITKLNIKAEATNGILAGSRFTLYKLYE
jgi:hypothetical protein